MIADLRKLWQEAFDEPDAFAELFFTTAYAPERCHCITENGVPVSALYWFDYRLEECNLAYIYAVATLKSHRGKGLAHRLMEETHQILRQQGYDGVILVPAGKSLCEFYRGLDYEVATTVTRLQCQAGNTPATLWPISPEEYLRLLPSFLPEGGVIPGKEALAFLQGYSQFYAGEDFLLIFEDTKEGFKAQELLGNTQAAPGILKALGFAEGRFRIPGTERDFAMFLPLREHCPKPGWFSLALD